MAWTCPTCGRSFARNKQWHSCEKHDINTIFADKPAEIRDLYEIFVQKVQEIGPMEIHVAKWNISCRAASTFVGIFPEKRDLAISFVRDEPLDDFPVYATHHYSKNRWSNHVKIEEAEEIDEQLLRWIKDAYQLCS